MLFLILKIFVFFATAIVVFFKWKFRYWKRHNYPSMKASIPFGSSAKLFSKDRDTLGVQMKKIYDEARGKNLKHIGFYFFWRPTYMPIDPIIIKAIMSKDFEYFPNRGIFYNEESDPLSAHLFSLDYNKWKALRAKLTPTFSSGKIKSMFATLTTCGDQLKTAIKEHVVLGEPTEIKDVSGRYTTNVIGSCAFGLDCNAFDNAESEFFKHAQQFFKFPPRERLKQILHLLFPKITKALNIPIIPPQISAFFMSVVKDTVKFRETSGTVRNDFLQLMIELTKNESLRAEDSEKKRALTINELAAQAFLFFLAGYESSSTTMTFCLLELAQNLQIQQQAREEIYQVLERYEENLTYQSIHEMKYMEQIIEETLRKYPPVPILQRKCVSNYKIPDTNDYIEKGVRVIIPVMGLHHNSHYFPNPEKFDPDRFSDENRQKIVPFTYLPFGDGPRNCLGLRFGMLQIKVGLVLLLKNFAFSLNKKTALPVTFDPANFILSVKGGVWLDVQKLD